MNRIAAALLAVTALSACSPQDQDQTANKMGAPEAYGPLVLPNAELRMKFANCIKATVAPYNNEDAVVQQQSDNEHGLSATSITIAVPGTAGAEATAVISETPKGIRVSTLNTRNNDGVSYGAEYADYQRADKNMVVVEYQIESNPGYVKDLSKNWADFGKVGMMSDPATQKAVNFCAQHTFKTNFILKRG